ncbi:unnamed protein product [Larinioides sclopetarius]|uniref:DNA-directed DNA polymerase n=1 Tax=Larinioides sclopetarius TaxID=280406 RepID=A0AAV2BJK5_9ARAC
MEYPSELHDLHNSYPLAPERINITPDNLSPTALEILSEMNMRPATKSEKLVPNLCNKKNYVLHYRNLKLYIQLGLKLVKILRILKFRQTPWLKAYINFNTEQRKQAKTTFEKDFFKLLNNAVYGKTMENLRNRIKFDIVQTKKKAEKLVASPAFHSFTIFDENLVAVQRKLTRLYFNRPIQVGFNILELSKVLMYDFHYNIILKKYGDKAKLLFTDTDSLCYELITDDLNRDFEEMKQYFDFSDYSHDHPLYSVENKKKIGFFKDELNGQPCFEFVGLRSKMYSILSGKGEKQTAKDNIMLQFLLSNCFARQGESSSELALDSYSQSKGCECPIMHMPHSQETLYFKLPPRNQVLEEDCATDKSFLDTEYSYVGGLSSSFFNFKELLFGNVFTHCNWISLVTSAPDFRRNVDSNLDFIKWVPISKARTLERQNICVEWLLYTQAAKIMYSLQLLTFCTDGCSVLSRMDADPLITCSQRRMLRSGYCSSMSHFAITSEVRERPLIEVTWLQLSWMKR